MVAAAARQFVVTVQGIQGTFSTKTGGEKTSEASRVYDGGDPVPQVLSSLAEVGDVTIGRPFDPDRDQDLVGSLLAIVGDWRTTITVTPTYGDLSRARVKPRVYSNCLLTGVSEPEFDAGSSDAAMLELTFAVAAVS